MGCLLLFTVVDWIFSLHIVSLDPSVSEITRVDDIAGVPPSSVSEGQYQTTHRVCTESSHLWLDKVSLVLSLTIHTSIDTPQCHGHVGKARGLYFGVMDCNED